MANVANFCWTRLFRNSKKISVCERHMATPYRAMSVFLFLMIRVRQYGEHEHVRFGSHCAPTTVNGVSSNDIDRGVLDYPLEIGHGLSVFPKKL